MSETPTPPVPVTIDRERLNLLPGRYVHVAHSWLYTVTVDGETFQGRGVGWARDLARRKAPGRPVVETWKAS